MFIKDREESGACERAGFRKILLLPAALPFVAQAQPWKHLQPRVSTALCSDFQSFPK